MDQGGEIVGSPRAEAGVVGVKIATGTDALTGLGDPEPGLAVRDNPLTSAVVTLALACRLG